MLGEHVGLDVIPVDLLAPGAQGAPAGQHLGFQGLESQGPVQMDLVKCKQPQRAHSPPDIYLGVTPNPRDNRS